MLESLPPNIDLAKPSVQKKRIYPKKRKICGFSWRNNNREQFEQLHQDYITGKYDSHALAAKYGIKQPTVLSYVVRWKWRQEMAALGIPHIPENFFPTRLPFTHKEVDEMKHDYCGNLTMSETALKYGISTYTLMKMAKKFKWMNERQKRRDKENEIHRPLTKAEKLRYKVERIDRIVFKFIDQCHDHFEVLLKSVVPRKECCDKVDIQSLRTIITDFAALYQTLRKIKSDLRKGMPAVRGKQDAPLGDPVLLPIGPDGEEIVPPPAQQKAQIRKISDVKI